MAEIELSNGDRAGMVGTTGSGKSLLARALFLAAPGRRVVVDPFDSEMTSSVGEQYTVNSHAAIDWARFDTWRIVPPRSEIDNWDWYSEVYEFLFDSSSAEDPLFLWTDEAGEMTTANRIPRGVRLVQNQGRKRKLSHEITATRPALVHGSMWSQLQYWAIFQLPWPADKDRVASAMGVSPSVFDDLQSRLGRHGFFWYDVRERRTYVSRDGLSLAEVQRIERPVPPPVKTIDGPAKPQGGR